MNCPEYKTGFSKIDSVCKLCKILDEEYFIQCSGFASEDKLCSNIPKDIKASGLGLLYSLLKKGRTLEEISIILNLSKEKVSLKINRLSSKFSVQVDRIYYIKD